MIGQYGIILLSVVSLLLLQATHDRDVQVVQLEAKRYQYTPPIIRLKQGKDVELHIQSKDVLHGFSVPDLNIRADLLPGEKVVIPLTGLKAGVYPFLCDIFCGMNHDQMHGRIVVE